LSSSTGAVPGACAGNLSSRKVEAQVLATTLSVYATTASLGGNADAAYGFTVSATGLGARSFSVGADRSACGVATDTTLNVYELLLAANKGTVNGVLYNGDATLRQEAADLFAPLDQAGDIGSRAAFCLGLRPSIPGHLVSGLVEESACLPRPRRVVSEYTTLPRLVTLPVCLPATDEWETRSPPEDRSTAKRRRR
jgi:hypothetical protein